MNNARLFPKIQIHSLSGDRDIINEACKQYQTVFINHHIVGMDMRLKKYIRARSGDLPKGFIHCLMAFVKSNRSLRGPVEEWLYELQFKYADYAAARRGSREQGKASSRKQSSVT